MIMPSIRRVLSVASECVPVLKTGGLADVVGALPAALAPWGWESRVLLPAYPQVLESVSDQLDQAELLWHERDLFGGPADIRRVRVDELDLLLLIAPHLYERFGGPYGVDGHDHHDNHVRFAALSWAGAQLAIHGGADRWIPDLVHAHDWQAGLLPSYLKYAGSHVPSVMTVHNMAFQGVFGADQLDRLRLPTWDFHPDALEYHGLVSSLKAGMVHAAALTTVSPTYAQELTTAAFGFGLEGVVASRRDRGELYGILNGIDPVVWDPEQDPEIQPYQRDDMSGKAINRTRLVKEFSLKEPSGPLAVVVTRLTHQKGVDLLLQALPDFLSTGGAVVVLGSGDTEYEEGLRLLQARYPDAVGLRLGYDEGLSHRMFGGGDLVLVPSRFEPCGLTQLYGLKYGTLPVAASTGGLADTVFDVGTLENPAFNATGFSFGGEGAPIDAGGLGDALSRAQQFYADTGSWKRLQNQAMGTAVDWSASAKQYCDLFNSLV